MENECYDQKQQILVDDILDKKFEFEEEYDGQQTNPAVEKWKVKILEKYGEGGQFYFCKLNKLYYYAEKDEEYGNRCPRCHLYCCPFCDNTNTRFYENRMCCIKGKIRHTFLHDMYYYISPRKDDKEGKEVENKPEYVNYIPFISTFKLVAGWLFDLYTVLYEPYIDNFYLLFIFIVFCFYISIPYFFLHYILIAILGLISIFNKKPLYGYFGIADHGGHFLICGFF